MKTSGTVGRLDTVTQPDRRFIADGNAADHIIHGQIFLFCHGQNCRNHSRSQMDCGKTVAVIIVHGVTADTVGQGGILQGCLTAQANHRCFLSGKQIQVIAQLIFQKLCAGQRHTYLVQNALACLFLHFRREVLGFQRIEGINKSIRQIHNRITP